MPWEFAWFTHGDESGIEVDCYGGGKDKTPSVNPYDFIDGCVSSCSGEKIDGELEKLGVGENWGNVFKNNARFWEIDDVADVVADEIG